MIGVATEHDASMAAKIVDEMPSRAFLLEAGVRAFRSIKNTADIILRQTLSIAAEWAKT